MLRCKQTNKQTNKQTKIERAHLAHRARHGVDQLGSQDLGSLHSLVGLLGHLIKVAVLTLQAVGRGRGGLLAEELGVVVFIIETKNA